MMFDRPGVLLLKHIVGICPFSFLALELGKHCEESIDSKYSLPAGQSLLP